MRSNEANEFLGWNLRAGDGCREVCGVGEGCREV